MTHGGRHGLLSDTSDLIEHERTTFNSQRVSGGTEKQDDRGDMGASSSRSLPRLFRPTLPSAKKRLSTSV